MTLLADAVVLARKDLTVEFRSRTAVAGVLSLAGISLLLVGLAVGPDPGRLRSLAPATVWIVLVYATLAVAERFDRIDRADDGFSGLWLAVSDRRALYLGRLISLTIVLASLEVIIWLGAILLLDLPINNWIVGLVPLALFTGLAAGAASAVVLSLLADIEHRTALLPVALLPLLVPTFLAGVQASSAMIAGRVDDLAEWLLIVSIEAALFIGVGLLTYEIVARPG